MIDSHTVKLIEDRFALGKQKYGHGVKVFTAFTKSPQWGCSTWMDMAREEFLDGIIYVAADYIHTHVNHTRTRTREPDHNDLILTTIKNWEHVESETHREMIRSLAGMIQMQ